MNTISQIVERLAKNPAVVWVNVDVADIVRSVVNLLWKVATIIGLVWAVVYTVDNITIVQEPTQQPEKAKPRVGKV